MRYGRGPCFGVVQIASLITVYLMRNISVEELSGFREALLEMRVPVDLSDYKPIDIVGTGGDGKNTFNISTASCFVVAGAGYNVENASRFPGMCNCITAAKVNYIHPITGKSA